MPGKDYVAGRCPPVLTMKQVGLIDRPALPFVDRSGVPISKILEHCRIELDGFPAFAVKHNSDEVAFDGSHGSGLAVIDAPLFVRAGELNRVIPGKAHKPVFRLE